MAEQSRKPPEELLNSSLAGGSITKLGPRKWASKGSILGDITSGDGEEEEGWLFPGIYLDTGMEGGGCQEISAMGCSI